MSGDKPYRVTCKNKYNEKQHRKADWPECRGCQFVYTYLSDNGPSYDVVRCDSPLPICFGETIEVIPEQARKV